MADCWHLKHHLGFGMYGQTEQGTKPALMNSGSAEQLKVPIKSFVRISWASL